MNYTAEGIKLVTENTAKFAGGSALKLSLGELKETAQKPQDNRSNEEIKNDMIEKMHQFRKDAGLE